MDVSTWADAAHAPGSDDIQQHRPPELRPLLSPELSERLPCRSTDEWSSSVSTVSIRATHASALVRLR